MIKIEERQTVKVPGLTSLFVSFQYNKNIVDCIKKLETCFYNSEQKEWEVPLTAFSELVDRCCEFDEIDVKLQSDIKKDIVEYPLMDYKTKPFEYQRQGIEFGLNHNKFLLLDDPGLGKTLQLLYLAQELKKRENIQHCLIICGINALKMNWKSEIEKHSDLDCVVLGQRVNKKGKLVVDGINERLNQLKNPINEFFVITNIETLRNDQILKELKKSKVNKFDMIVLDEIHKCKSNSSQQGKNLLKLNTAKYMVGATGTLLLNSPLDCYVPLSWIGVEHSTFSTFKYYYCSFGGNFNNELTGYKNTSVLKNQIEQNSLRRTKDILGLPPKVIIPEFLEMSPEQEVFYNNIKNGVVEAANKVTLRAANILSLCGRLRQATACPSILTTDSIPSAKLDRAEDLIDQIVSSGNKVVVFSIFKETVYELARRVSRYGVVIGTGDQDETQFEQSKILFQNDPDVHVFIGTHQKSGTGITLTAANYLIFIDTPWTAGDVHQCEDRIHRIGTTSTAFIYHLITSDTIDERVYDLVQDKAAMSDYIVDDKITQAGLNSLRKYIEELQF